MYRRMTPLLLLFFLLLNCWAVSSFDSIASVVENNGTLFLVTESESESNIYIVDENLNIISNVFHVNSSLDFRAKLDDVIVLQDSNTWDIYLFNLSSLSYITVSNISYIAKATKLGDDFVFSSYHNYFGNSQVWIVSPSGVIKYTYDVPEDKFYIYAEGNTLAVLSADFGNNLLVLRTFTWNGTTLSQITSTSFNATQLGSTTSSDFLNYIITYRVATPLMFNKIITLSVLDEWRNYVRVVTINATNGNILDKELAGLSYTYADAPIFSSAYATDGVIYVAHYRTLSSPFAIVMINATNGDIFNIQTKAMNFLNESGAIYLFRFIPPVNGEVSAILVIQKGYGVDIMETPNVSLYYVSINSTDVKINYLDSFEANSTYRMVFGGMTGVAVSDGSQQVVYVPVVASSSTNQKTYIFKATLNATTTSTVTFSVAENYERFTFEVTNNNAVGEKVPDYVFALHSATNQYRWGTYPQPSIMSNLIAVQNYSLILPFVNARVDFDLGEKAWLSVVGNVSYYNESYEFSYLGYGAYSGTRLTVLNSSIKAPAGWGGGYFFFCFDNGLCQIERAFAVLRYGIARITFEKPLDTIESHTTPVVVPIKVEFVDEEFGYPLRDAQPITIYVNGTPTLNTTTRVESTISLSEGVYNISISLPDLSSYFYVGWTGLPYKIIRAIYIPYFVGGGGFGYPTGTATATIIVEPIIEGYKMVVTSSNLKTVYEGDLKTLTLSPGIYSIVIYDAEGNIVYDETKYIYGNYTITLAENKTTITEQISKQVTEVPLGGVVALVWLAIAFFGSLVRRK